MSKAFPVFHLCSFFLLFSLLHPRVISQDLNGERTVLLNLKRQLGNPPSIESWNSSSSPCDWPGISCTSGSVTGVLLSDKSITAQIPPTVCDLQNLTVLAVSNNYVPGEFPQLYKCSKLQELDLSQNLLVGLIPADIGRFTSLKYLDLSGNNFSGDIPSEIGLLVELQFLYLHSNLFNGTFPKEIGNLVNLEYLFLSYNHFVPMEIPQEFGQLKKLKYLWIKQANLIGQIPETLGNLPSLEHLDLCMNNLKGPIPGGLFMMRNLTKLYLYHNKLSGEIPRSVETLDLEDIDLSANNLTGSIPQEFGKLQSLKNLNLYWNQLSGEVPASIGLIPTLIDFKVFNNKLSGVLPPQFGQHSKLEAFEVSDNQFTGGLPENLCAGGVLQGVVAFSNNLSGEVPKSLGNCSSLRVVELYNNRFSGEVPSGIWTSFNLSGLMLSNNSFSGKLPEKVAWNLSRVEISDNQFSGEIPSGISSWSRLTVFKASNNLFSGKIPKEITYLSHLLVLFLDGNQLSGALPSEIVSWISLITLNLTRNRLSGGIPAAIARLPNLLDLDLSDNQLSGVIPPEVGGLRLTSLNLSSNQLSGKIPMGLDNPAYENSFLNNPNLCADKPFVKLRNCNATLRGPKRLSPKYLVAILVLAALVCLVLALLTLFMVRDYQRKKRRRELATWKLTSFHRLDFTAVNVLSSLTEHNLIGSGGSGKVYKIVVGPSGESVAVKRIWNKRKLDHKLEREFLAEVEILGRIRHSNIVKLWCCIASQDSKLLVYEYMENQSLDRWLHGKKRASIAATNPAAEHNFALDWPTRLRIAIGAARGLSYMHHDCSPPIIHRDIKSSNILLDSEFNAKIADFGLAKMQARQGEAHTMSAVAGSFGYLAPEYTYTTKVDEKIDVYSFGVVLLELVTGREAHCGDEDTSLAEWAWRHYSAEKPVTEVLEEEVKEALYLEDMISVYKLGLICTSRVPSSRPSMKDVVQILRRCTPLSLDVNGEKKLGSEFDAAPLLGSAAYVSSYKGSKKGSEDDYEDIV